MRITSDRQKLMCLIHLSILTQLSIHTLVNSIVPRGQSRRLKPSYDKG